MTDNLRAGIEAKIAEWERHGLAFKRESPAIAATIRNIMADFRARLAAHPVQDEGVQPGCDGSETCPAPAHVHGCYADLLGHCDAPGEHVAPAQVTTAEELGSITREEVTFAWHDAICPQAEECPDRALHAESQTIVEFLLEFLDTLGIVVSDRPEVTP